MVDQAKVNGRGESSPASGVGENVADLTHDLLALAELQFQLLLVDLREGGSHSKLPLALIAAGALLALGTVPVALLGIGWLLVNLAELSQGVAFLVTAAGALLLAGLLAWWGYSRLRGAMSLLTRSRGEFAANIHWIKQALKQRTPTHEEAHSPIRF